MNMAIRNHFFEIPLSHNFLVLLNNDIIYDTNIVGSLTQHKILPQINAANFLIVS